ncbi:hypothetical protein LCGC14_2992370, partial [marine sediment metagenome]
IVDRSYQREASHRHAQKILKDFRWVFFQAITVTPLEGGKYAVEDGQHRVIAARNHSTITRVPCCVVAAATVAEQARGFVVMNETHRRITPAEMYWAALTAEDPEYLRIAEMLKRVGVDVHIRSGGVTPPCTTLAINTIRKILRRHDGKHLELALTAMVKAWPAAPNAFTASIIEASELLLRTNADINVDKLFLALSLHRPVELMNAARVYAADNGLRVYPAMIQLILDQIKNDKERKAA